MVIIMDNKYKKMIYSACEKSELFSDIKLPLDEIHIINANKNQQLNNISNNAIILILSGKVDVYTTSYSGDEVYLSTLKVGECTGISNIFNKNIINTVIKCSTDVTVLSIPEDVLKKTMRENFVLAHRLLTLYNSKIQFLIGRIESLTIQSVIAKLAHYLLSNKNEENYVYIPSKQKLAEYLGVSRASLYREIAVLKASNVIETNKRFLYIKNEEALKNLL